MSIRSRDSAARGHTHGRPQVRIRSKILVPVIAVSVLLFSAAAAVAVVTTVSAALDGAKRQVGATVERYAYRMEARLEKIGRAHV